MVETRRLTRTMNSSQRTVTISRPSPARFWCCRGKRWDWADVQSWRHATSAAAGDSFKYGQRRSRFDLRRSLIM